MRFIYKIIILFCILQITFAIKSISQTLQWAKAMGGTGLDYGYSIAVDISGNVYTLGYFAGTADFDPGAGTFNLTSAGGDDIFISKLDASGNFVWAKAIGGTGDDYGYSITIDASGNIYTTGFFESTVDFDPGAGTFNLTSAGYSDIFISKLDTAGNLIWAKQIGGIDTDGGYSIKINASGDIYTTGYFGSTVDFDPGVGIFNLTASIFSLDAFILKLDNSGNFIWAKQFAGWTTRGRSITTDSSDNVLISGDFRGTCDFDPGAGTFNLTSPASNYDIFVSKLDSSGNFVWAASMGGTNNDNAWCVATDVSGNVYTTGFFQDTADFDPGAGIFNLTVGGIFISKLDSSGNFVWAKQIGGTTSNQGFSIALDASSNVYTTGYFTGTVDFDPGLGVFNLTTTSALDGDIFISKLDSSGNFVWAGAMGGASGSGGGSSIALDVSGNIYTTGVFLGTTDFDPGMGTFNLTSVAGSADIFVHKMSQPTGIIENNISQNQISVFPNPSTGIFTIQSPQGELEIYNVLGEMIYRSEVNDPKSEIDLSDKAKGVYFLKLQSGDKFYTQKVIVQ